LRAASGAPDREANERTPVSDDPYVPVSDDPYVPVSDDPYVPVTPPQRAEEALGPAVEIVSAGNEVLLGDVLDTNTNWLCLRVTALGGHVRRTMMLRDEVDVIAQELRAAVARRPALIFTVGGLGPTTDDLTLAGVAAALGVPLELHPLAERMVRERYEAFAARRSVPFAGMNDARRKMARLPRGATPLTNSVGGAPGVLIRLDADGRILSGDAGEAASGTDGFGEPPSSVDDSGGAVTTIVSLPGVPGELRAIVDESLGDSLASIFGDACFEERVLIVDTQDESAIAHVLAEVEQAHPHVYIKSRAQLMGSEHVNRITAAARGADAAAVAALLDPVIADLCGGVEAAGFTATPARPD
jgi:molybdopterin-biosynthesis enzyme MoeA-like protein